MSDNRNPFYNAEGYPDPTAFRAISTVEQEEAADNKAAFLVKVLKFIIRESDFELLNRIELKDRKTGRTYR